MRRVRLLAAIGLVCLAGCWIAGKPVASPTDEEGRRIVLKPGEDACVACVGQAVEFPFEFKAIPAEMVETLAVRINGKRVDKPALRRRTVPSPNPVGVGDASIAYVFRAREPGTYRVRVTPHYLERSWGDPWECVVIVKGADS